MVYFVLAKRAGEYNVPAVEEANKVNYMVEMEFEELEGSKSKVETQEDFLTLVTKA